MTTIKIISDSHNDHNQLSDLECDILIHCGDVGAKGKLNEAMSFLYWFVKQPAKYKIVVPGNHDKALRIHPDAVSLARDLGIHLLNDDALTINGIKMYGASRTFWSEEGKNRSVASQKTRQEAWQDIPENLDILITHMPPKYILDSNPQGEHCGCSQLSEKVKETKPKYHLFGHIHHHGGKTQKIWDTIFINAAVKNEQYLTVRGAMEIKL